MISAYPLQWPAGWKRTESGARKAALFTKGTREYSSVGTGSWMRKRELSVSDGVDRVLQSLTRMDIDRQDVVISTNVRTTLAGLPRSGERKPEDPGAAVYWQEQPIMADDGGGARRVMAIDIYDDVADNLAAIAATLEALRAIERHGGAAILERAFTGFTALPSPESGKHWREVLNLPGKTVERSHIDEAYRSIARRVHPDKGGTHEQMAELNRAREQALQEIGP